MLSAAALLTVASALLSPLPPRHTASPRRVHKDSEIPQQSAVEKFAEAAWAVNLVAAVSLVVLNIAGQLPALTPEQKTYILLYPPIVLFVDLVRSGHIKLPETQKDEFDALVIVDPTCTARPVVLDRQLAGRTGVVAPELETLDLATDLSKAFEISPPLSVKQLARNINAAGPQPVVLILDVPRRATAQDLIRLLTDARAVKAVCNNKIKIVVCVDGKHDLDVVASPDLRKALHIVRNDEDLPHE